MEAGILFQCLGLGRGRLKLASRCCWLIVWWVGIVVMCGSTVEEGEQEEVIVFKPDFFRGGLEWISPTSAEASTPGGWWWWWWWW